MFQQPGQAQITDLSAVAATLIDDPALPWQAVRATIPTPLGTVQKEVRIHRDAPRLDVLFQLNWAPPPLGVLRLGHVTPNPDAFQGDALWYATHHGGPRPERFALGQTDFDHGRPVSHMVSANTALGMTEGSLLFGDDRHCVTIDVLRDAAAVVPMIALRQVGAHYFFRVCFTAGEIDDTVRNNDASRADTWPLKVGFSITLGPAGDPDHGAVHR